MFDVFYFGDKPNLFEFERYAESIDKAASMCRTGCFWYIYGNNDYANFDFSWRPAPWESEQLHVWKNQWQPDGQVYFANVSTYGNKVFNYHDSPSVHRLPIAGNWYIPDNIDVSSVDTRWCPDPMDPPYVYHFPSQHQSASGVTYTVDGATDIKLCDAFTVDALNMHSAFKVHIQVQQFDWSWHPNPLDPPMIYVFGNQWNPATLEDTITYTVNGATERKYMDEIAIAAPCFDKWEIFDEIVEFDYSWRPNPTEPPYTYIFGNQWLTPEQRPALRYHVDGATEIKYMEEPKAKRKSDWKKFKTHVICEFDYSWEPDPGSPPYNYVFGNQWHTPEIMPTVEYHMQGATETKFIHEPFAKIHENRDGRWHKHVDCEWDFSWVPDPGDPAFIYVFGNQWHDAEIMPTVEYHVDGATERKFMDYPRAKLLQDKTRWAIPEEVDVTNIDFSWVPDPGSPPYIYHFGTEYQMSVGLTYTVPTAEETRFEGTVPRIQKEKSVVDVLDIFFIDRGNPIAQARFERLLMEYPKATKLRYANSMMDTINRCITRTKTSKFWVVSSEYDYDDFDFHWHAQPWQSYMTHVFPSQHQKWSDTFLINKYEFERHAKWAKGMEEFPNLNFVTNQKTRKVDNLHDIYYVDHGNPESQHQFNVLRGHFPDIIKTRAANDYLDVMKRIMSTANTEYVWIINSICNYDFFDFTWQPEPWQKEMIHCFANGNKFNSELRGDTFYIHVESFKSQMVELELLDWFNVINYVVSQPVDRWPAPAVYYDGDDLIGAIKNHNFTTPYALFTKETEYKGLSGNGTCLWTEKDRTVHPLTKSNAISLVPRDVKKYLKTQMYDYPYLDKPSGFGNHRVEQPLDIVYISNGEPDAERWFSHLDIILFTKFTPHHLHNRIRRVQNVNGRVAAYQAAANASTTPWFFAVFAKLEVSPNFDWNWQPDYWQEPKHYIFNALNPINGLEYGHMGMIAYNKRLVLENNAPGIDFTLSQPHESVPILSGTAHYNQDAWTTWRTAFREVLKLRLFMDTQPTLETEHRLNVWKTVGEGQYAGMSIQGALDAVRYYEEVGGEYSELMKSFEWDWLRTRFNGKTL